MVAADYIRNLREETRKGFYGRIKQGLYPLPAPLGYLDKGKGNVKVPDPIKAPLVRKAFELYGTARHNLDTLVEEMFRLGLRNRTGHKVTRNGLSVLFNNPFYIGLIRLRRTGETFPGSHRPLIRKSLFDRVQQVLSGKANTRIRQHDFLFRRLLTCRRCHYSLTGEIQKGHTYYRCHIKSCPKSCVREDIIEEHILQKLSPLQFTEREKDYFQKKVSKFKEDWGKQRDTEIKALGLRLDQLQDRLARLTDAYIDKVIEKEIFEERKTALLLERKNLEERQRDFAENRRSLPDRLAQFFELAESAHLGYKMGLPEEKRDLLKIVTSNREVEGKNVDFTLSLPFSEVANRFQKSNGSATGSRTPLLCLKSTCPNR